MSKKAGKKTSKRNVEKPEYVKLLHEIKTRIRSAQYEALKAVNKELIALYWDIGKMITGRQKGRTWGNSVVPILASDLQAEFPGMGGFSSQNLWRMKQFYQAYAGNEKLSPLVREIGWTHNVVILMNCKDELERKFYIRMTRRMGWSKNVLIHQIENKTYEKTLLNQTSFNKTLPEKIKNQAKLAVKLELSCARTRAGQSLSMRFGKRGSRSASGNTGLRRNYRVN